MESPAIPGRFKLPKVTKLQFLNNHALVSLSGLSCAPALTLLSIQNNSSLTSMNGLDWIEDITQLAWITGNDQLPVCEVEDFLAGMPSAPFSYTYDNAECAEF